MSGLLRIDQLEVRGVRHAFEQRDASLADELPSPVLRLQQIHGSTTLLVDSTTDLGPLRTDDLSLRPRADALVTGLPDITVAVATADCVPVLVADRARRGVAAIHAGWRGIALGIVPSALATMARELGTRPADCVAGIGPCVGADSYRVGADVRAAFLAAGVPASTLTEATPDPGCDPPAYSCDLASAVVWQLRQLGLPAGAIGSLGACTVSEPSRFHSWRRDGEAAGRMLSGISLTG